MQLLAHRIGVIGALQNPAAIWVRDRVLKLAWNRTFHTAEHEHVAYGTRWASGTTASAT